MRRVLDKAQGALSVKLDAATSRPRAGLLCANAADIRVVTPRTPAQARRMDKLQWRLIAKHGLAGARILRALADELDDLRRFAVG